MKIVCISDTHGKHKQLNMPEGDMVIFAGDMCNVGRVSEVERFFDWFLYLDYEYKICIPGNHDWPIYRDEVDVDVLVDRAVVINNIKIYGSPWQPEFCGWAYNLPRGKALADKWDAIPDETDILVTHGPPAGILDGGLGCVNLRRRTEELKLKLHVFGHIHYAAGKVGRYVNASLVNDMLMVVNKPWEVEV